MRKALFMHKNYFQLTITFLVLLTAAILLGVSNKVSAEIGLGTYSGKGINYFTQDGSIVDALHSSTTNSQGYMYYTNMHSYTTYTRIYVNKMNMQGELQWTAPGSFLVDYVATNIGTDTQVFPAADGGVFVLWTTQEIGYTAYDYYTLRINKFDANGNKLWTDQIIAYDVSDPNPGAYVLKEDSQGNVFVTYNTNRNLRIYNANLGTNNDKVDLAAQKLNSSGVKQWSSPFFPTSGSLCTNAITPTSVTNIYSWEQCWDWCEVQYGLDNTNRNCTYSTFNNSPTTCSISKAPAGGQNTCTLSAWNLRHYMWNSSPTIIGADVATVSGAPLTDWGVQLAYGANMQQYLEDIIPDGSGGAIFTMYDDRDTPLNEGTYLRGRAIYGQTMNSSGVRQSSGNGTVINSYQQGLTAMAYFVGDQDDNGNYYWFRYYCTTNTFWCNKTLYVTKYTSGMTPIWSRVISTRSGEDWKPEVAYDQANQRFFIVWDNLDPNWVSTPYAQILTEDNQIQLADNGQLLSIGATVGQFAGVLDLQLNDGFLFMTHSVEDAGQNYEHLTLSKYETDFDLMWSQVYETDYTWHNYLGNRYYDGVFYQYYRYYDDDLNGYKYYLQGMVPGYQVSNLDAGLNLVDADGVNVETGGAGGLLSAGDEVYLKDTNGNYIASLIYTPNGSDRSWSNVVAEYNVASGKSVVYNLASAPGASATHSLFIPRKTGDGSVWICPNASTLEEITLDCTGGYLLYESSPNVDLLNLQTGSTIAPLLNESFSTNVFAGSDWTTGGNASWALDTVTYDSSPSSINSGVIANSQSTWASYTDTYDTAGNISFDWKVSSENGYDYLTFCIDSVTCQEISGEVDWNSVSVDFSAGEHTFTWTYSKDSSSIEGTDEAWVDDVVITSSVPIYTDYWKVSGLTGTGGMSIGGTFELKDVLTRLQMSTPADHHLYFGTFAGLTSSSDYITLTFDTTGQSFNLGSIANTDIDLLANSTSLALGTSAGADIWGVTINTTADTITFSAPTSGTAYITDNTELEVLIGTNATGGVNQIVNPAAVDTYDIYVEVHNAGGLEEGTVTIPIIDSDQVNITGYVNTFINFDIDTAITDVDCSYNTCLTHENGQIGTNYTVDLGELNSTWVNRSNSTAVTHAQGGSGVINSIWFNITTNAYQGAVVYVTSANAGLQGPSTNLISSVTDGSNITANSGLYGFQLTQAGTGNGTIVRNTSCDTASEYCGPDLTQTTVFTTNNLPLDGGRVRMDVAAAAAYTNNPGNYTDTLTFIATGSF